MIISIRIYIRFPRSCDTPALMVIDLLAQTLDVNIHGTGIADIFIAPYLIQKLFSCENMVR